MLKRRQILIIIFLLSAWGLTADRFLKAAGLPEGSRADKIIVLKEKRKMILYRGGQIIKTYRISLGRQPVGAKTTQGDGRTPEGRYRINARNPHSRYYLSLKISYPDPRDRAMAEKLGVNPGGDIMIHGLPNKLGWLGRSHRLMDWTDGCIAVTNKEMDELWRAVPLGTPIEIRP